VKHLSPNAGREKPRGKIDALEIVVGAAVPAKAEQWLPAKIDRFGVLAQADCKFGVPGALGAK
jgi:hypothetical protein